MTETAKRTLPWSGGVVEKGKPVPSDVPEGYLTGWRKRGFVEGEPDRVSDDGEGAESATGGASLASLPRSSPSASPSVSSKSTNRRRR